MHTFTNGCANSLQVTGTHIRPAILGSESTPSGREDVSGSDDIKTVVEKTPLICRADTPAAVGSSQPLRTEV